MIIDCYFDAILLKIQISSIFFAPTMLTPTATPATPDLLPRTPHPYRRQQDFTIPQNSNSASTLHASLSHNLNQEDTLRPQQQTKIAGSSFDNAKPSILHHTRPEMKQDNAPNQPAILQKPVKESRKTKRATTEGNTCNEDNAKKSNGDGFMTSRSIVQDRSLSKLNSNYLEASLKQEEEMFKLIQEKALMLKKKQKKGREILKKIRKSNGGISQSQSITASLSAIGPDKTKFIHKRGQSCDLPLPDTHFNSQCLQSLEKVNSEQEDNESLQRSVIGKSFEAILVPSDQLLQVNSQLTDLKGELERQKSQLEIKQQQIESQEKRNKQLETQLQRLITSNQASLQTISVLRQEKTALLSQHQQQNQLQLKYQQELAIKNKQISQLNTSISQQTKKLGELYAKCSTLEQQHTKDMDEMQIILKQNKAKTQEYQESKRKMEKDLAQLTEEKRKAQQSYAREIQSLKSKFELQSRQMIAKDKQRYDEIVQKEQRLKTISDELNRREAEMTKSWHEQQIFNNKLRQQLEASNRALKEQINQQSEVISKLNVTIEEKQRANQTIQHYLANAEAHIRKVEEKYHATTRQLTQKNVSYDFLWIQMKEEEQKRKHLEEQLKKHKHKHTHEEMEPHVSLLHSSENDSPVKQEENGLNRILSSSTLKDIKDLQGMIEQGENNHRRVPSEREIKLPISHRPSLPIPLLTDSKCSVQADGDVVLQQVKPSSGNMLLKQELSQAFSEQNDEIYDMVSNHNSNTSKMESSLGAFSEYSRAKSTQSALTHKQVEQEYHNKMKNSKLMAKLGKFKPKK